jgi:hypothetical protein
MNESVGSVDDPDRCVVGLPPSTRGIDDEPRPEWVGTKLTFELTQADNRTVLRFGQRGWREASDFYMHCNCKWAYFLTSLKLYAERGRGTPYPEDLDI